MMIIPATWQQKQFFGVIMKNCIDQVLIAFEGEINCQTNSSWDFRIPVMQLKFLNTKRVLEYEMYTKFRTY